MKYQKILLSLVLAVLVHTDVAYRILCIYPYQGKSHFQMFGTLSRALAKRGHKVDVISHFPTEKPLANYTDIINLSGKGIYSAISVEEWRKMQLQVTYFIATMFGNSICDLLFREEMQNFIKNPPNDPPYDLVIAQYFGSPCYLGFGNLLNVPVVIVTSFLEFPFINTFMGNTQNDAFFSGFFNENPSIETFFDRLWNAYTNYHAVIVFQHYSAVQTDIMRKAMALPHMPDVRALERQVALALVNTHYSYYGVKPITPAMIEVGGLHVVEEAPKLSPEIKKWLDSADHGLVYFSLGTILNIEKFPEETVLKLYRSLAKISPIKVLMKSTNASDLPAGLPSNVLTASWVSQFSVLKHKNTRVFVTHGGLMGTQEAIYCGVPMIGIPVFADQVKNIKTLEHKNVAVLLDSLNITEQGMDSALNKLLHDPKYRESAKRMSRLFRDRPMSAVDTAIYWIEYVVRNGPDSLRSSATELPWWKITLIDVFAFLAVCFALLIYSLWLLLKLLSRNLYRRSLVPLEKKLK
ncbi:UDP-glucuronosyltransferase 1-6 [Eufriesea mexicana]|uniref:UDP-glucuronosyltransferase 1-6-like n=1 Tax=Eufriesea mexicana TaxID=516756 RepID=UPI00083C811C|nr:PREDICTED: UDP-glucuronosyltransferase 1-6-like [Eufriesea mexicana]OAD58667.1 UDP-glucuronosyltransferase 1-6 [Eufriesea mexicana]